MVSWAGAFRVLVALVNSATVYVAPSLSCAALVAALRHPLGIDGTSAVIFGGLLPVGPVYLWFASTWGMKRFLVDLRSWHEENLIDETQYHEMRASALAWFRSKRAFGAWRPDDLPRD